MTRRWILVLVALVAVACCVAPAQDSEASAPGRRLIHRVSPVYPELARRMSISGLVKVVATVAPNGSVKSIEPLGGNPLLLKATQDAVMNWKYTPATAETKELIELRFSSR